MIRKELCKRLIFYHTEKWHIHKSESVQENETHKIIWNFEIQTGHLILARQPDRMLINEKKKTCNLVDFAISADHKVKIKENKKIGK